MRARDRAYSSGSTTYVRLFVDGCVYKNVPVKNTPIKRTIYIERQNEEKKKKRPTFFFSSSFSSAQIYISKNNDTSSADKMLQIM